MTKAEAIEQVQNVISRLDAQGAHACAGWDCSTCSPAQNRGELSEALDVLRQDGQAAPAPAEN